jgi:O-antigen/teichoic acid export membrane protein
MSRNVAKNALWNVGGQLASLSVGLVALPLLLHELGAARLGVFTLALGLIGFSGLFDLGLGRALTQTVSSSLGQGRSQGEVAALVSHVIGLLAAVGTLWTVALWWAAPFLVDRLFPSLEKWRAKPFLACARWRCPFLSHWPPLAQWVRWRACNSSAS